MPSTTITALKSRQSSATVNSFLTALHVLTTLIPYHFSGWLVIEDLPQSEVLVYRDPEFAEGFQLVRGVPSHLSISFLGVRLTILSS